MGAVVPLLVNGCTAVNTVNYAYDTNGNLTDVIDVNGGHTQYSYDSAHRLVTMRWALS